MGHYKKEILEEVYAGKELIELSDEEIGAAFSCGETKEEEEARIAKEEEERRIAEEAARQQKRAAVVAYAKQFIGNPYVYGGTSLTRGTDCSGFVMSVYANFGVKLPHSSAADRKQGYAVDGLNNAQPGDLICYSGHVALYIGNGQIVHAANSKKGIIVSKANYQKILAIRRIF